MEISSQYMFNKYYNDSFPVSVSLLLAYPAGIGWCPVSLLELRYRRGEEEDGDPQGKLRTKAALK